MNLLFITNVPSPYRVDFFNELGKLCNLTVIFEKQTSDERDSSWKKYKFETFEGIFLKGISVSTDQAICFEVIKYVANKKYDEIICADPMTPTGIIAIYTMKMLNIPYFIEADGGTAKSGKGIKEKFKKSVISGAKGYLSSSKQCDDYFITYGAKKERIFRYPFTSLKESDILKEPISADLKKNLREELDLKEEKIIISVGRFSYMNGYGKGYDTLLKVCEMLPESYGVYIIGDEPTEEFKQWKTSKNLKHLYFLPFKQKQELFKYYQAADMSVLLTRGEAWGLVVNESLANGCPVITTDACIAGLELIKNNTNGYIVSINQPKETYEKLVELTDKIKSGAEVLTSIKGYSIENMALEHMKYLTKDLEI